MESKNLPQLVHHMELLLFIVEVCWSKHHICRTGLVWLIKAAAVQIISVLQLVHMLPLCWSNWPSSRWTMCHDARFHVVDLKRHLRLFTEKCYRVLIESSCAACLDRNIYADTKPGIFSVLLTYSHWGKILDLFGPDEVSLLKSGSRGSAHVGIW